MGLLKTGYASANKVYRRYYCYSCWRFMRLLGVLFCLAFVISICRYVVNLAVLLAQPYVAQTQYSLRLGELCGYWHVAP